MRRTKGAGRRSGMNISAMLHMRAHEGHLGRVCFPLLLLVLLLLLLLFRCHFGSSTYRSERIILLRVRVEASHFLAVLGEQQASCTIDRSQSCWLREVRCNLYFATARVAVILGRGFREQLRVRLGCPCRGLAATLARGSEESWRRRGRPSRPQRVPWQDAAGNERKVSVQ